MLSFDQFKQTELRVAKITASEAVEGSDKLLRLQLSLGEETRQIVAGIAKRYKPEDLIGTEIVIVANLEPRTLMGLESQGMLLAADSPDGPVLVRPDAEVMPGSLIK